MAEMAFILIASQLKIIQKVFQAERTNGSFKLDGTAAERTNRRIDKIEQTGKNSMKKRTKGPPIAGRPFYNALL